MQQEKALELFLEREVRRASTDFVIGAMSYLKKENKRETELAFIQDFITLFNLCSKHEKKEDLSFVQLTLVRGRALLDEPFYRLEAYGSQFYLEEPLVSSEANLWWLYEEYQKFCKKIDRESKRYIQCFHEQDLSRIKLIELTNAEKIVRYLYTNMLVYLIHTEAFEELQVKEGFQLQLGEYKGPYQNVFEVNERTKKLGRLWHAIL